MHNLCNIKSNLLAPMLLLRKNKEITLKENGISRVNTNTTNTKSIISSRSGAFKPPKSDKSDPT